MKRDRIQDKLNEVKMVSCRSPFGLDIHSHLSPDDASYNQSPSDDLVTFSGDAGITQFIN